MPYRTNGSSTQCRTVPLPLTIRQKIAVLCKGIDELSEQQWYRQHVGGLWCLARRPSWTELVQDRLTNQLIAQPLFESFGDWRQNSGCKLVWYRLPEEVRLCPHEDEGVFRAAVNTVFSEDYALFTLMSFTLQHIWLEREENEGVSVCTCEKYDHRWVVA